MNSLFKLIELVFFADQYFNGEQVVDGTGYLKIVDFGSAKRLPLGKKTNTVY